MEAINMKYVLGVAIPSEVPGKFLPVPTSKTVAHSLNENFLTLPNSAAIAP
jgi:hypothetical protein